MAGMMCVDINSYAAVTTARMRGENPVKRDLAGLLSQAIKIISYRKKLPTSALPRDMEPDVLLRFASGRLG